MYGLLQESDSGGKFFVSQLFQRLGIPPIDLVQDGRGFSPCRYLSPYVEIAKTDLEPDKLRERFGRLKIPSQDLRPDGLNGPLQARTLHLPDLLDGLCPSRLQLAFKDILGLRLTGGRRVRRLSPGRCGPFAAGQRPDCIFRSWRRVPVSTCVFSQPFVIPAFPREGAGCPLLSTGVEHTAATVHPYLPEREPVGVTLELDRDVSPESLRV